MSSVLTAPQSPRAPSTTGRPQEFYGFVAWISTSLLCVLYFLWALLPDEWIVAAGVTWYPSREWAILVPSYTAIVILLTYFSYFSLAISSTPSFSDLRAFTDTYAHIPVSTDPHQPTSSPLLDYASPDAIAETYDIPIGLVNRVVYRDTRRVKLKGM
ncbi:hypothetical protein BOTBODRAFT_35667 [Botryobasidium botryosum FD-172 SS1]|uniref:PIG-P domain-containing protein n=1 Tax=Botryobasidium botryosum (strain FD-172 SS1) TaxID=930990 RepID=A0A067M6D6_BOTB1|nr:hypothetical protein BOTBODRAFT_35667 [Botryobasidium botryosum FD-172 SS1]